MDRTVIGVPAAAAALAEAWRPRILARANGQEVKIARLEGPFVWHRHTDEDEVFLGIAGRFRIEFRDRVAELGPGDLIVVPKGVEHRPVADEPASVLLFEPAGVRNTGDTLDPRYTSPAAADDGAETRGDSPRPRT